MGFNTSLFVIMLWGALFSARSEVWYAETTSRIYSDSITSMKADWLQIDAKYDSLNEVRGAGPIERISPVMPRFDYGTSEIEEFVEKHLAYPELAKNAGVSGTVYLMGVVQTDGKFTHIEVMRGVHQSVDDEALRIARKFPRFSPGKKDGKRVRCYFAVPIKFTLD